MIKRGGESVGRASDFTVGQPVLARDYRSGTDKWAAGLIKSQSGPVSYVVNVNGEDWRRHADQLRSSVEINTSFRECR